MKTVHLLMIVTALGATFSINAQQRPNGGVRDGINGGGSPPSPDRILSFLDKDGDSLISREEASNARHGRMSEIFDTLDTNKDGYISAEELSNSKGPEGERKRPTPKQMIAKIDINQDGFLDKIEVDSKGSKRLQNNFARIDTNKDEKLSKVEIDTFFMKRKKRRQ